MIRPRRASPPLWFQVALVAGVAWLLHAFDLHAAEQPQVMAAWFAWLVAVAQAIWAGVQAFGALTLAILGHTVSLLWEFAKSVHNGLLDFSRQFLKGGAKVWEFFRGLYDDVLKPAWQKFWKLVDAVRDALDRVFGPVIDILNAIRREILEFYDRFVRPVLDTIDVIQKALRVLSSAGVEWAKKLDDYLTKLEEKIQAPFTFLLRKVNEIIGIVNRVVTADGLFQRLALVRSIERDLKYIRQAWVNALSKPLTEAEKAAALAKVKARSEAELEEVFRTYFRTGGGPQAPLINELVMILRPKFATPK